MFGQVTGGLEWVSPLLELAKAGSFVVLSFYLIVVERPKTQQAHREELAAFRTELVTRLERIERQTSHD